MEEPCQRAPRGSNRPVKNYTFKCIRAGGPGPAVHMDICANDDAARARALSLFALWPLAVKVDVIRGDEHFEVERPSAA